MGGLLIYGRYVQFVSATTTLGPSWKFTYFLFFKKISLEHKTRIYIILIFLLLPLPLSGILDIVAFETFYLQFILQQYRLQTTFFSEFSINLSLIFLL